MARDIPLPHPGARLEGRVPRPDGPQRLRARQGDPCHAQAVLNDICLGRQGITAAIALRLGRFFGVDPQWFMNMQSRYDLSVQAERLAAEIAAIEPRSAA